jgi:phage terminase large subunit-like protein
MTSLLARAIEVMPAAEVLQWIDRIEASARPHAASRWDVRAQTGQSAPEDEDWFAWLIMAGRGFGKTRAGAEWVHGLAHDGLPGTRIALVAATLAEARAVMVEGESGLLATAKPYREPAWFPATGKLVWPNGVMARLHSAESHEALRGSQFHYAWCDEIAKWPQGVAAWDNLMMALRLGERPRVLATTTPRPVALVRRLVGDANTVVTRGRTADNAFVSPAFVARVTADYGGTRLGRQELDGELIEDVEGAVWTRAVLEACRTTAVPTPAEATPEVPLPLVGRDMFRRVVIGVDPPASATGDACGIVVVGLRADGVACVLEDASVERAAPEIWAAAVASCAAKWGADRIVAEANNGGAMVASVLRAADAALPLTLVHASHGKVARAEPVRLLYDRGLVRHAGTFPRLEDEMCGMTIGGGYAGPGRSPDRADALVWALTALMLSEKRGTPRVRVV